MSNFDKLPTRDRNSDVETKSVSAFREAIESQEMFIIQHEDKKDYGTDFQLEVRDGSSMTNCRVHVQLKGTEAQENSNSSVSRSIQQTNLNYLWAQPSSIYVCYHLPSQRLLVRLAEDVYSELQHRNSEWSNQESITVQFTDGFSPQFQEKFASLALARHRSLRDSRLSMAATPPQSLHKKLKSTLHSVTVPLDVNGANELLSNLISNGADSTIGEAFDQFRAVLSPNQADLLPLYLAEINLGINHQSFDKDRVITGIEVLEGMLQGQKLHDSWIQYNLGNALMVLGFYENARNYYIAALMGFEMEPNSTREVAAKCKKNLGATMELLGNHESSLDFYKQALELDANLGEAHFALAIHYRNDNFPEKCLTHLDAIIRRKESAIEVSGIRAWRTEALFLTGDFAGAFRDLHMLMSEAEEFEWIWPWCAQMLCRFGSENAESARKSFDCWTLYIAEHPDITEAKMEVLKCAYTIRSFTSDAPLSFDQFKGRAEALFGDESTDSSYLFDRIGHWAQLDGNWELAEYWYRRAYDVEQEAYGYCLGVALNRLERYAEALPILLEQAENHHPDGLSWTQVARAREGVGDFAGCIEAYEVSIELDPEYAPAYFELGGLFWNKGETLDALEFWTFAIENFPKHELSEKLQHDLPELFPEG